MQKEFMKNIKLNLPFHNLSEFKFYVSSLDAKKVGAFVLCIAFFVIALMLIIPDKHKEPEISEETAESAQLTYEENLEHRLETLLADVEGVGDCNVLVTLESGEYKMFAKDSYEDKSGNKYEYVIVKGESGSDEGLCVSVIAPEVRGVAIVCDGGDSAVVKSAVITTVSSVLGINSTQISVSKMK